MKKLRYSLVVIITISITLTSCETVIIPNQGEKIKNYIPDVSKIDTIYKNQTFTQSDEIIIGEKYFISKPPSKDPFVFQEITILDIRGGYVKLLCERWCMR